MLTLNSSIEASHPEAAFRNNSLQQLYVLRSLWEDGLHSWIDHNALCRSGQMFHGVWFPFLLSPAHSAPQQQLISLRLDRLAPCSDILPGLVVIVTVLSHSIRLTGLFALLNLFYSLTLFLFFFLIAIIKRYNKQLLMDIWVVALPAQEISVIHRAGWFTPVNRYQGVRILSSPRPLEAVKLA